MGKLTVTADCRADGPLADGRADAALGQWSRNVVRELTEAGRDYIKTAAESMDRSGRGGTGRAAGGVEADTAAGLLSGGIRQGEYSWPWLEGTSKRNVTTGFKGYRTFSKTRTRLNKEAQAIGERELAKLLPQIGGQ